MTKTRFLSATLPLVLLTGVVGCSDGHENKNIPSKSVVEQPKPPMLEEWEQKALEFTEFISIQKDIEKASKIWRGDPDLLQNTAELYPIKPGKVKIASQIGGANLWTVYIFVPSSQSDRGSVLEVHLGKNDQNIVVYNYFFDYYPIRTFEEFQLSQYWEEKGRRWIWIDAELH